MLISLIVVINVYVYQNGIVYLKYIQFLFFNYTSIKLEKVKL